jgi:predicted ATPase
MRKSRDRRVSARAIAPDTVKADRPTDRNPAGEMSASAMDSSSTPATTNNLPLLVPRIIGRDLIIAQIQEEVVNARLNSIVGAGGIGKTTVALAIAAQALPLFADGVWWVDFAPLLDPSLIPNAIAAATGLAVHSADILQGLCGYLRNRRVLLVLDNCEHVVDAIASCGTRILDEAPGVHILTTSRASLGVDVEHVHELPGLAVPRNLPSLTAEAALTFPAVQLFVERAADRQQAFVVSDDDAPVIADICRSLDGIALAIELAAMRVDVFGLNGLKKQLDDRFRILGGRRGGLERHRTLAATLDWSYNLLSAKEASLLCAVCAFAGAFRASDARAVSDAPAGGAPAVLAALASKSLLSVESDADGANYRPLETTRAYCLEKLLASGDDEKIRLRHAEYICATLERAAKEWDQQQSREWGKAHGHRLDDLRAALSWTNARPAHRPLLIRLTDAGTLLWNHFSLTDESRVHLMRAISCLQEIGTAVEMKLQLAFAGALLYTRGIVPEAREAMRRALCIAEERKDADFTLRCLRLVGTYELFGGETDSGIRTLERFLAIAAIGDPSALPEGETHLSVGEMFVGRLRVVRERLGRLHEHSEQDVNDVRFARFQYSNSVNIMIVLSHVQWLTGSPGAAAQTAALIVDYLSEVRHELSASIAHAWLCLVFLWLGRDEDCRRHVIMLDELVERHGIVTWRPVATFCRSALVGKSRDDEAGRVDGLKQAISEFRSMRHMARLPYYLGVLAEAVAKDGALQEAERTVQEALDLAITQNEKWCIPELYRIQASIKMCEGRPNDASALLRKAIATAETIEALSWQLRAANDLAALLQTQSRSDEARSVLLPVYGAFADGFVTPDLAAAAKLLSELE